MEAWAEGWGGQARPAMKAEADLGEIQGGWGEFWGCGYRERHKDHQNSWFYGLTARADGASLKRRYPIWSITPSRGFAAPARAQARQWGARAGCLENILEFR